MSTLAAIADEMDMTPGDVVIALNNETDHWKLGVQREGSLVKFYVAGEVYPIRNGRRAQRGKRPFYCAETVDAVKALYLGLDAAREIASR